LICRSYFTGLALNEYPTWWLKPSNLSEWEVAYKAVHSALGNLVIKWISELMGA